MDTEEFEYDGSLIPPREIMPYAFEPIIIPDSVTEVHSEPVELADVIPVDEWCTCQNCTNMPTVAENRCCSSYRGVRHEIKKYKGMKCITDHPGFRSCCLNQYVLQASLNEFIEHDGPMGDEVSQEERFRYMAYRKFVYWIFGRLGRGNRKIIPSCAVTKIRDRFPSDSYTGFQFA